MASFAPPGAQRIAAISFSRISPRAMDGVHHSTTCEAGQPSDAMQCLAIRMTPVCPPPMQLQVFWPFWPFQVFLGSTNLTTKIRCASYILPSNS